MSTSREVNDYALHRLLEKQTRVSSILLVGYGEESESLPCEIQFMGARRASPTVRFKGSSSSLAIFDGQNHGGNRGYGIGEDVGEDKDINPPSQSRSGKHKKQLEEWKLPGSLHVVSVKALLTEDRIQTSLSQISFFGYRFHFPPVTIWQHS